MEDLKLRPLRIAAKKPLAEDIWLFELVTPDGSDLPAFEAGAHIAVETPSGKRRQYSLCNAPAERHRYVIAVKAERPGRGGSTSLIDGTAEGDELMVCDPENNFRLVDAPDYIFVAGGIGITPIISMIRHLETQGRTNYRLIYCTRAPEVTAFLDELSCADVVGRVTIYHDGGDPDRAFDFWDTFEKPGKGHVYCCGPTPLMEEVRGVTGHWPQSAIHFEDFATDVEAVRPDDRAFTVRHAETGEAIEIPADRTILETLRASGHRVPSSCESGTCGTCKTVLVSGEADHRDMVLTDEEKKDHIMICVSRAVSDELVLKW
jgi:phthalate 4,5-dioxygenase reductase subunit